jgi:hypothetical protein
VRFCTRVKWRIVFVLLWATTPVCGAAQTRSTDVGDFTYYWQRPLLDLEEDQEMPSPANATDPDAGTTNQRMLRATWLPGIVKYLRTGSSGSQPGRSTVLRFLFNMLGDSRTKPAHATPRDTGLGSTTGSTQSGKPEDGMTATAGMPATLDTRLMAVSTASSRSKTIRVIARWSGATAVSTG